MRTLFSLGDTTWQRRRPPGAWRDFKVVLNQVTHTIEPSLPLSQVLNEWNEISEQLAEPPRRRVPQLSSYFD